MGRYVIIFVVIVLSTIALAEWMLQVQAEEISVSQSNYEWLREQHAPFARKYPNSAYGFLYVPEDAAPVAFGNAAATISPGPFRGPGPSQRPPDRLLAFLVGDSVVFGFAPHDSVTITGFLNRIQDKYFFVNAGAPSWVGGQSRRRMTDELLAHRPSLIVFWGGYNDASVAYRAASEGHPFEPERIEAADPGDSRQSLSRSNPLPEITGRLKQLMGRLASNPEQPVGQDVAVKAAESYVNTVFLAELEAESAGAKLVVVYQPLLHHHRQTPPNRLPDDQVRYFDLFYSEAADGLTDAGLIFLDLARAFDDTPSGPEVFHKGFGPDLDDQVFVDHVHLHVPGNKLVAEKIAEFVMRLPSRPS